ncbi:hypothetical protein pv_452 [Pithovirus sibericum]|uniref:Uncharacterized protein n=1 Tax=Pithovirus sibericum TaxID=1450746 RepID=W5S5G7_9VIRU|nr:hypothetical protein pv_452 [Pithovirus sibericum]AHH02018.1 hypothetical protein pv_452 [Pithovirus sibericum]
MFRKQNKHKNKKSVWKPSDSPIDLLKEEQSSEISSRRRNSVDFQPQEDLLSSFKDFGTKQRSPILFDYQPSISRESTNLPLPKEAENLLDSLVPRTPLRSSLHPKEESPGKENFHSQLRNEELRNTLLYLASLIPSNQGKWNCHFIDGAKKESNVTLAQNSRISIRAELTSEIEQFILLPFGNEMVWCQFAPEVEFEFSSLSGNGKIVAVHTCENAIHKLIFPEEVSVSGKECSLRSILPVILTHG